MAFERKTQTLSLAESLRPALLRASRHLRREAQRAGVSVLDAQLLNAVKKEPGVGVGALAEREQMTAPSMSSHVKRLLGAGWISRDPASDADRRRIGIRLTREGARALEAIRRRRNDWLAERLAALTGEERSMLEAAVAPLLRLAGD